MARQVASVVLSRQFGSTVRKAVALVIADHADADEWATVVGQVTIAAEAEVGVRSVRRVLAEFEGEGLIRRERRHRRDGSRTSDRVVLVRERVEGLPASVASGQSGRLPRAYRPENATLPASVAGRSEPSVEPTEPKGSVRAPIPDEDETNRIGIWTALEELFGEVATKTGRSGRAKVARSLFSAGATYSEILLRAGAWEKLFPGATRTDFALEKHWGQLGKLVAEQPRWSPESCTHPAAADVEGDGSLWCPACERVIA